MATSSSSGVSFSGLASGIDTAALIDATIQARTTQRITPSQTKITELTDTNSAIAELKTRLDKLQTVTQQFSSIYNNGVVKTATSGDETILTATAASNANNGTYTLTVNQLAKNATYSFKSTGRTYSSVSDAIAPGINNGAAEANRTIKVETGLGTNKETVNVVLTNTSSLDDFVTSFNSQSTKGVASVVNVGTSTSPSYRVIVVGNYEGTEKGTLAVTMGSEITTNTAWDNNSSSAAQDATFSVTGIGAGAGDTITRASNTFSDVLPGMNVTLRNTGTTTVQVGDDAASSSAKVQEFITAYNDVVTYLAENNQVTRKEDSTGVTNIFGPLSHTTVDEGVLNNLRSDLAGTVYSGGSSIKIFSDLGITTQRDGTLNFDSNVLEKAISGEPNSVRSILQKFGDKSSLTGGTIDMYTRFSGLLDLTTSGNTTEISDLNQRIAEAQKSIDAEAASMKARFATLEGLMSTMQSQQSQLTAALSGLN